MISDHIAKLVRENREQLEAEWAARTPEEQERFDQEVANLPRYNPFACPLCRRVYCRRGCPNWEPLNLPGFDEDGKLLA